MYNFLAGKINPSVIIYRFGNHGSRNLSDLTQLTPVADYSNAQYAIMYDQEPLMFEFYNHEYLKNNAQLWYRTNHGDRTASVLDNETWQRVIYDTNLAFMRYGFTDYDRNILVHSELRSPHVANYQKVGFETVYWWSHAMIARDWYRFAELDPKLPVATIYSKDFNIYARAWYGYREYRLKLLDFVVDRGLGNRCQVNFAAQDGVDYRQHEFIAPKFKPVNDLGEFSNKPVSAAASASYSSQDYQTSWFDIVLETLFDDDRLHVTEKTLRPIACGKPFIVCGTHGTLEFLQSYGFKTFAPFIDESYDKITDPIKRLEAVADLMSWIANLDNSKKQKLDIELQKICTFNRELFFSNKFAQYVVDEFDVNFNSAYQTCQDYKLGQRRAELDSIVHVQR